MRFALVNNNKVERIDEVESQDEILDGHRFQAVIDLTDLDPQPQLGWLFKNGGLISDLASITPRQLRLALVLSGVDIANIDTAISMLPEPTQTMTRIEWEYAIDFERANPMVAALGAALGLTNEQIDAIWVLGATI